MVKPGSPDLESSACRGASYLMSDSPTNLVTDNCHAGNTGGGRGLQASRQLSLSCLDSPVGRLPASYTFNHYGCDRPKGGFRTLEATFAAPLRCPGRTSSRQYIVNPYGCGWCCQPFWMWLAERVGFEPTEPREGLNGFRDRPIRPLWHLSAHQHYSETGVWVKQVCRGQGEALHGLRGKRPSPAAKATRHPPRSCAKRCMPFKGGVPLMAARRVFSKALRQGTHALRMTR